jgi:hypothetical protein
MSAAHTQRTLLLELAAEAAASWLGENGRAPGAAPRPLDRRVAAQWADWLRLHPPEEAVRTLAQLAALSADDARREAAAALDQFAPPGAAAGREAALDFLADLPRAAQRGLVRDRAGAWALPPDFAPADADDLLGLLSPLAPRPPAGRPGPTVNGEDVQTRPDALRPSPAVAAPPPAREAAADVGPRVRLSPVVVKLRVLLRCHAVAARARRTAFLFRLAASAGVVLLGLVLGALAGFGVFWAVYNNPNQYAQSYPDYGQTTYYVKGARVSQQEYDYFLATESNLGTAVTAAVAAGLGVLVVFVGSLWLRGRKPTPTPDGGADEQAAAIVRDHPEEVRTWGGPPVLRRPELVAEVLRIEERGGG